MDPGTTINPGQNNNDDQTPAGDPTTPAAPPADEPVTPGTDQPGDQPTTPPSEPTPPAETPGEETPPSEPTPAPETPGETPPAPDTSPPEESPPSGSPDSGDNPAAATRLPSLFSWEASEYIEHAHGIGWYVGLIAATLGLVAVLVFIVKEFFSAIVVLLMVAAIVVYAHRKPRSLRYAVSDSGIMIGDKSYPYSDFKSFAIVGTQSLMTVELDPIKRFMPRLSMVLDPQQAEAIAETLQSHLPREDRQADFMDRLAHSLKF